MEHGFYVQSTASVSNSSFHRCSTLPSSSSIYRPRYGGGFALVTNGRAAVLGSSFTQCYAEEDGGGLMITDYATTSGSGDQIIAGAQLLSSAIAPDIV